MSITLIVVLIIAASLIIGPLAMLRPDPIQKNKEKMRLLARASGVHYSIRNIPQQGDEAEAPEPFPVYFLPPNETQNTPGWMLVRTAYEHEIHFMGWWAWQGQQRASGAELAVLKDYVGALPESVRAIGGGGKSVSVYWSEKGGEPVLQQILGLISALKQAD